MIRCLILIGLLLGANPAIGQDALPAAFYGKWRGEALTTSEGGSGVDVTASDLSIQIEPVDDGFQMHWTALSHEGRDEPLVRQPVEAHFAPTGRQGVYAFDPKESSLLLRLFGDPSTNNPLEGEPLLWARFDGKALSVYGLVINDEGGFDLYQHVRTLTDDGSMTVRQTHRTEQGLGLKLEGLLQREGG